MHHSEVQRAWLGSVQIKREWRWFTASNTQQPSGLAEILCSFTVKERDSSKFEISLFFLHVWNQTNVSSNPPTGYNRSNFQVWRNNNDSTGTHEQQERRNALISDWLPLAPKSRSFCVRKERNIVKKRSAGHSSSSNLNLFFGENYLSVICSTLSFVLENVYVLVFEN